MTVKQEQHDEGSILDSTNLVIDPCHMCTT